MIHRRLANRLWVLSAALLTAWTVSSEASSTRYPIHTDPSSGVEITVESDFDNVPAAGYAPFHVTVQNNSNRNGSWDFIFTSSPYRARVSSSFHFSVEAGQTRTFPILALEASSLGWQSIHATCAGPGVEGRAVTFTSPYNPRIRGDAPLFAMSHTVGVRTAGPLKEKLDKLGAGLQTQFDATLLPEDWRGYSGIDWLCLTGTEWRDLQVPVRTAIRQWIGQGGHLLIADPTPESVTWREFGGSTGRGPIAYGFGDVRAIQWTGGELDEGKVCGLLSGNQGFRQEILRDEPGWSLFHQIKEVKPSSGLIFSFVLVFAAVIGPANLFWFAPSSRRHRLFFTTPAISLAGCLVLGALILIRDGVGGSGMRFTVVQLFPEAHEENIVQEQIARTGLLLGSSYKTADDILPFYLKLTEQHALMNRDLNLDGNHYSGDWFRSRFTQAQHLRTVRPSREAVSVVGTGVSGAPVIISSVANRLDTLVLVDSENRLWQAENVQTGVKVMLRPAKPSEVKKWWDQVIASGRSYTRDTLERIPGSKFTGRSAMFYASAKEAKGAALDTLPAIRWKQSSVVYLGSVVNAQTGGQSQWVSR